MGMSIKYCGDFAPPCKRKALKYTSGEGVRRCKGFAVSECDVTARYRVVAKNNDRPDAPHCQSPDAEDG